MNSRNVIIGLLVAAVIAVILLVAVHNQRVLESGLPPRTVCADAGAAKIRADAFAAEHGGVVILVLGTGSMAPYIPAAPAGVDPLKTVMAYAVTDPHRGFADIQPGNLCTYWADWYPGHSVMHGAAAHDGDGWIMSGLHNREYESRSRVTAENFTGLVAAVFTWNP